MGRRRPGARRGSGHRRGRGKAAVRRSPTLAGTLRVTKPGVATVETAEGSFRVARRGLREAMNGDEVTVSVFPARGGKKVALVQGVITRAQTTFLGRFELAGPLGAVVPLDARLGRDFFVVPEDTSPARLGVGEGDVVVARIAEYPTRNSAAVVTIESRVGSSDELDLNVESVIASYGLATEFPPAALAQAEGIQAGVEEALKREPGRRDLRSLCCMTIDPTDARDFDDAVYAAQLPDGGFELWVHIADVTHYVGWDTPIDNEAKRRTCSAYLVDRVLPMLPERLCNDVCSLRPREDRLAMSVRMELDDQGRLVSAEAMTSAIRSTARLDYDTVDALLAGRVNASALHEDQRDAQTLEEALRVLDRIRGLRERIREERGSIDFDTVEPKVTLDEEGHPTGVIVRTRTRATGLVEEAMLLANESVARMLADREVLCAYRVHERPSPEDLRATVRPLMELGLIDGSAQREALIAGEPEAINAVLDAARGTAGEFLASALLLRAQKRAIYMPTNQGHYARGAGVLPLHLAHQALPGRAGAPRAQSSSCRYAGQQGTGANSGPAPAALRHVLTDGARRRRRCPREPAHQDGRALRRPRGRSVLGCGVRLRALWALCDARRDLRRGTPARARPWRGMARVRRGPHDPHGRGVRSRVGDGHPRTRSGHRDGHTARKDRLRARRPA